MGLDFSNVENKLNAFLNPKFYDTPKRGSGLDKSQRTKKVTDKN